MAEQVRPGCTDKCHGNWHYGHGLVIPGGEVELQTYKVESLIPSPFCKWYRHPVHWWKLRHLRHDLREHEKFRQANPINAEIEDKINASIDDAFINGTRGT